MNQPIEAIYEEGVFKPQQPVHLNEHQPVRLIIEPVAPDSRQALIGRLKELGHLQGQPPRSPNPAVRLLTHEELQQTLPKLEPPLSKQILEDRR
jgi:predicted DNA-binding antitoxin AbrB/MazE fold protein